MTIDIKGNVYYSQNQKDVQAQEADRWKHIV